MAIGQPGMERGPDGAWLPSQACRGGSQACKGCDRAVLAAQRSCMHAFARPPQGS